MPNASESPLCAAVTGLVRTICLRSQSIIESVIKSSTLNKIICVYKHASCPASVLTPDCRLTATAGRGLGVEIVENINPTSTKNRSYYRVLQF